MIDMSRPAIRTMPMQSKVPDADLEATYELEHVPFYVNPVIAWRVWKVRFGDDGVVLTSVTYARVDWPRREELRAECQANMLKPHPAPADYHGCGIYSVKSMEDALVWARHGVTGAIRVVGEVKLWGRIFQYTEGYLAEFAYPASLFVPETYDHWQPIAHPAVAPEGLALALENSYAVPASVGWPK